MRIGSPVTRIRDGLRDASSPCSNRLPDAETKRQSGRGGHEGEGILGEREGILGEQVGPGTPGPVLATYREIAAHFGLQGPHSARTKAKREGWQSEPPNHPADPLRIRVPREAWDAAGRRRREGRNTPSHELRDPPSQSGEINALRSHIETLREGVAKAEARAERAEQRAAAAEERAEKADQRLIDELARLAAQNHPPATDVVLPDAALDAIRADLESEELPSNELHDSSDSGQRTRLAEALDIIRMELDGPMSNEAVPSAASVKPRRHDEEEGRGSDDQAMSREVTSPETRAEPIKELSAGRNWLSRFLPRRRQKTT